jgi:hypothetical protein
LIIKYWIVSLLAAERMNVFTNIHEEEQKPEEFLLVIFSGAKE